VCVLLTPLEVEIRPISATRESLSRALPTKERGGGGKTGGPGRHISLRQCDMPTSGWARDRESGGAGRGNGLLAVCECEVWLFLSNFFVSYLVLQYVI
jgi:hypothetical protein